MAAINLPAVVERVEHITSKNASLLERIGYTPEAYARVAINALVLNPSIVECSTKSIDAAFLRCMNAGLIPDGREAAIVPFKKTATFIPMVEGRVKLARQATPGIVFRVMAVYHGDDWEYSEGLFPRLRHVPNPAVSNAPEDLIYVYAIARIPGAAEPEYDVMSRATIDRYRAMSLMKVGGPWDSHFEEMAKNAILKRLLKRLPKSAHDPGPLPPELDRIDTGSELRHLETTADGEVVDTETGAIQEAKVTKPSPEPEPNQPEIEGFGEPPDDDEAPF